MTSTGQRLYDALLAHPFIHAMPRAWDTPRDTAIAALDALALKARDYATKPSARTMLEQFRLSFPGEEANWPVGSPIEDEYAWWLYTHGWAIAVSPEPEPSYIPDLPADQVQMSGLDYPEDTAGLGNFHERAMELLREWAHNDEDDVRDTLDAQATYLQERGAWVTDSCAALGHSKDFLGAVMRYKKARLAEIALSLTDPRLPVRYIVKRIPSENIRSQVDVGGMVQEVETYSRPGQIAVRAFHPTTGMPMLAGGQDSCWWFGPDDLERAWWVNPEPGVTFTVTVEDPVGSGYHAGDLVEIILRHNGRDEVAGGVFDVRRVRDGAERMVHRVHLSMAPLEPEPEVQTSGLEYQSVGEIVDAQVQPLQDEVTRLTAALAAAERNYANSQANHRNDLDIIARHFWTQAWGRGWCSEAEDVIEQINEETHLNLENDRDVYRPLETFYFDIDVKVSSSLGTGLDWYADFSIELPVEARDRSAARDTIDEGTIKAHLVATYSDLESLSYSYSIDEWDFS